MYARDVLPGDRGHFLATIKAALEDETKTMTWPVHDIRGITDTRWVVQNLPAALALPGGVWNFGSEHHESTYTLVKSVLEQLGQESALRRLTPNEEAFADNPRDISMDLGKLNAAGIFFPTTEEGLRMALKEA
jgi:dTDP-4-dehydrorhamnose reductase